MLDPNTHNPPPKYELFYNDWGISFSVGKLLGKGGEGEVYAVQGNKNLALKIYKNLDKANEFDKIRKLSHMIQNRPRLANASAGSLGLAWPSELAFDSAGENRRFIGYTMPRAPDKSGLLYEIMLTDKYQATWRARVRIAHKLSKIVASLHEIGYVIGDFKSINVLVTPKMNPILIDTDSMQVEDMSTGKVFYCTVFTPEYMAPELAKALENQANLENYERDHKEDCFALAVMIFQLLMLGVHPYSGRNRRNPQLTQVDENVAKGNNIFKKTLFWSDVIPSKNVPDFEILPPNVLELFRQTFTFGHENPQMRPPLERWIEVLAKLDPEEKVDQNILQCSREKSHFYSAHLKKCCWCSYSARVGIDPFFSEESTPDLPEPNIIEKILNALKWVMLKITNALKQVALAIINNLRNLFINQTHPRKRSVLATLLFITFIVGITSLGAVLGADHRISYAVVQSFQGSESSVDYNMWNDDSADWKKGAKQQINDFLSRVSGNNFQVNLNTSNEIVRVAELFLGAFSFWVVANLIAWIPLLFAVIVGFTSAYVITSQDLKDFNFVLVLIEEASQWLEEKNYLNKSINFEQLDSNEKGGFNKWGNFALGTSFSLVLLLVGRLLQYLLRLKGGSFIPNNPFLLILGMLAGISLIQHYNPFFIVQNWDWLESNTNKALALNILGASLLATILGLIAGLGRRFFGWGRPKHNT